MNPIYLISGAGTGIGKAIALHLAQLPSSPSLYLLGRTRHKLEAVQALLPDPHRHHLVIADVANRTDLSQAIVNAKIPYLTGVISNAGTGGENHFESSQTHPHDRWDEILGTNLTGAYYLSQVCLPALLRSPSQYRHIVFIASILSRMGVPRMTAYCASKAGLLGLARSLASEHAAAKILVNTVCPGWVETEMAQNGIQLIAQAQNAPYAQVYQAEMDKVPLGKMSRPEEVASLVAYLVGDQQTSPQISQISMTGAVIDLNNGAWMA